MVKNSPQNNQSKTQQPKNKPPKCPSCKKDDNVRIVIIIILSKNFKLMKKVPGQDHYFSSRLPCANKKSREKNYSMVNGKYETTEDIISKLKSLKGKTKLKFHKNMSNYYDEMNIRRQSGTFQF